MKAEYVLLVALCFTLAPAAEPLSAQSNDECLECHDDPGLMIEDESGHSVSMHVAPDTFATSVHGEMECVECHIDIEELPHDEVEIGKVNCGMCHEDAVEDIAVSVHGRALKERSPDAPTCVRCHGKHDIHPVDHENCPVSKAHQPVMCAKCHANPEVIRRNKIPVKDPIAAYEHSIHGKLAQVGEADAATCTDCHGGHRMLRARDPVSTVNKANIARTCSGCHPKAYEEFTISAHATALEAGAKDAPSCMDCHGEHDILRPDNPESRTSGFNVAAEVCSPCHASERLATKYGLAPSRMKSYQDSYHGLAARGGKPTVANCGSCHGVHDVLPSTDPRSHIHPANLAQTCGVCHPNAGENFTKGQVHLVGAETTVVVVKYARFFYIGLILVTIGFMVVHNLFDFLSKVKKLKMNR